MTGKHFAVGLAAVTAILALASQADAEILSLDCTDQVGQIAHVWVDLDKLSITWAFDQAFSISFPPDQRSFPAQISATAIKWSFSYVPNPAYTWVWYIDRTTGAWEGKVVGAPYNAGHIVGQCSKGSTPLPATKF